MPAARAASDVRQRLCRRVLKWILRFCLIKVEMAGEPQPLHDEILTRYLLGQLPTEQADALDERSVVDPSFAERLRGVKLDLADAYVRGELSPAERQHWERTFIASRAGQEHIRLAEALALTEPRRSRSAPVSRAVTSSPWTQRRMLGLAAAAALALTLSAAYATRRSEPEPGGFSTAATIGLQPSAPPAAVPTAPPPSAAVIALTLAAPTRNQAEPPVLTIPTGAPEVQLTVAPRPRSVLALRDRRRGSRVGPRRVARNGRRRDREHGRTRPAGDGTGERVS